MNRTPAIGWTILTGAALAASFGSLLIQLGFAILAIGVVGMRCLVAHSCAISRKTCGSFEGRHQFYGGLIGFVSMLCFIVLNCAVSLKAYGSLDGRQQLWFRLAQLRGSLEDVWHVCLVLLNCVVPLKTSGMPCFVLLNCAVT